MSRCPRWSGRQRGLRWWGSRGAHARDRTLRRAAGHDGWSHDRDRQWWPGRVGRQSARDASRHDGGGRSCCERAELRTLMGSNMIRDALSFLAAAGLAWGLHGCHPPDCRDLVQCPELPEEEPPTCDPAAGGINGSCAGVFVSSSLGSDDNPGTRDEPVRTLGKAMALAQTGARRVYACAEVFPEAATSATGQEPAARRAWIRASDQATLARPRGKTSGAFTALFCARTVSSVAIHPECSSSTRVRRQDLQRIRNAVRPAPVCPAARRRGPVKRRGGGV